MTKDIIKPRYKCTKCKHEYELLKPGPTVCIKCGYKYVDWLNWKEVIASLGDYGRA